MPEFIVRMDTTFGPFETNTTARDLNEAKQNVALAFGDDKDVIKGTEIIGPVQHHPEDVWRSKLI